MTHRRSLLTPSLPNPNAAFSKFKTKSSPTPAPSVIQTLNLSRTVKVNPNHLANLPNSNCNLNPKCTLNANPSPSNNYNFLSLTPLLFTMLPYPQHPIISPGDDKTPDPSTIGSISKVDDVQPHVYNKFWRSNGEARFAANPSHLNSSSHLSLLWSLAWANKAPLHPFASMAGT